MNQNRFPSASLGVMLLLSAGAVFAETRVTSDPITFSISRDDDPTYFVNPGVNVGGGFTERQRGYAEFDLREFERAGTSLSAAQVSFQYSRAPFDSERTQNFADISVSTYAGDNQAPKSTDFRNDPFNDTFQSTEFAGGPSLGISPGGFNFNALKLGDIVTFDVTTQLSTLLSAGGSSFGISLISMRLPSNFYLISGYSDFKLTETYVTAIPEPGTYALVSVGLLAVGAATRRRRRT